uniref:Uncharacterized protein n=1 Tax=Pygocentrus nattereri TaxID=42514 RepID=A0A3B4C7B6_PYGNA
VHCQNIQDIYPEVVGVHVYFLRVHHTELGVGGLDVVQVLHSSVQPTHYGLSVISHFGVANDCGGAGEVTKGSEVPLSPWSHDQEELPGKGLRSDFIDTDLFPQASDGAALGICPLNHADGL